MGAPRTDALAASRRVAGAPPERRGTPRWAVAVASVLASVLAATGCTPPGPVEDPQPPPAEEADPAPSGLRVGVVLVVDEGTDTASVDELETALEALAEERADTVATLRTVVPAPLTFAADAAGLLAADGADLVCLLGDVGAGVVIDLAGRFPGTRFCATGSTSDDLPGNVHLLEVAQEQLGYALGTLASAIADGDDVLVLTADDRTDRTRRREGVTRALGTAPDVLRLPFVAEDTGRVLDVEELRARLDARAEDRGALGAVILDAPPDLVTAALEILPPGTALVPARGTAGRDDLVVRYRIEVAAIVAGALDRLAAEEPPEPRPLGAAEGAFTLLLSGAAPEELGALRDATIAALAAGRVDLSGPLPEPSPTPSEGTDGDADADGADDPDGAGEDLPLDGAGLLPDLSPIAP